MGVVHGIADVILIIAALVSLIAFSFLAYAGWMIVGLVKEVKGEVKGLTQTAHDTLGEVQQTTRFMSTSIVKPVAQAAGVVSAARATLKALTEDVVKKHQGP